MSLHTPTTYPGIVATCMQGVDRRAGTTHHSMIGNRHFVHKRKKKEKGNKFEKRITHSLKRDESGPLAQTNKHAAGTRYVRYLDLLDCTHLMYVRTYVVYHFSTCSESKRKMKSEVEPAEYNS